MIETFHIDCQGSLLHFGKQLALNNATIDLRSHNQRGATGNNGAGETTLLSASTRLEKLDRGNAIKLVSIRQSRKG